MPDEITISGHTVNIPKVKMADGTYSLPIDVCLDNYHDMTVRVYIDNQKQIQINAEDSMYWLLFEIKIPQKKYDIDPEDNPETAQAVPYNLEDLPYTIYPLPQNIIEAPQQPPPPRDDPGQIASELIITKQLTIYPT